MESGAQAVGGGIGELDCLRLIIKTSNGQYRSEDLEKTWYHSKSGSGKTYLFFDLRRTPYK